MGIRIIEWSGKSEWPSLFMLGRKNDQLAMDFMGDFCWFMIDGSWRNFSYGVLHVKQQFVFSLIFELLVFSKRSNLTKILMVNRHLWIIGNK